MTTVNLCPDSISSVISNSIKKTGKGDYNRISYYIGFDKKSICGYFTGAELEKMMTEIEKEKNTFSTILTIDKSEITSNIIKHFRYVEPKVEFQEQPILIEPYILGLWLGDGHSAVPALTNIDIPIIDAWKNYASIINHKITTSEMIERKTTTNQNETSYITTYHIVGNENKNKKGGNILLNNLKQYNLINNKHIPIEYLQNSFENRLKLLAGLIDTDGSLSGDCYEISQKNETLSNDIMTLCRSLGFYTRFTKGEKSCMHNGTKRTGIYYRIIISLNQFSMELPVLLERKKWKYEGLSQKNICNPFIDINGNVMEKTKIIWTEDMKIKLYSIVEKINKLEPDKPIPWDRFGEFDIIFKDSSNEALRAMYIKTLLPKKDIYDKLVIDVNINLIEEDWMNKYNQIKQILSENKETFTRDNYNCLYNWINNQLHRLMDFNLQKKQLINELHLEITIYEWKKQLEKLRDYVKTNKKNPSEDISLNNWTKQMRSDYKNKNSPLYKNDEKRKLWETLIEEYGDIINSSNSSKKVKVIFTDGSEKIYNSQEDVAKFMECSINTIRNRIKTGNSYKDNKFQFALH